MSPLQTIASGIERSTIDETDFFYSILRASSYLICLRARYDEYGCKRRAGGDCHSGGDA